MLVLSRRENETLVINENINITIKKIHTDRVRFIIEGPDDTVIIKEGAEKDIDK
jgi:carbon storage regulator CsrA